MICLAKDASDQAFDTSLFDALPEVAAVPIKTFSTDGVLKAMVPLWKSLRAIASSLLSQQELSTSLSKSMVLIQLLIPPCPKDLELLAKVIQLLLQSLTDLQQRIVRDLLVPLEVTTDDLPVVKFAKTSCPSGLEFPS